MGQGMSRAILTPATMWWFYERCERAVKLLGDENAPDIPWPMRPRPMKPIFNLPVSFAGVWIAHMMTLLRLRPTLRLRAVTRCFAAIALTLRGALALRVGLALRAGEESIRTCNPRPA